MSIFRWFRPKKMTDNRAFLRTYIKGGPFTSAKKAFITECILTVLSEDNWLDKLFPYEISPKLHKWFKFDSDYGMPEITKLFYCKQGFTAEPGFKTNGSFGKLWIPCMRLMSHDAIDLWLTCFKGMCWL